LGFGFGWASLPCSTTSSSFTSDFALAPSRLGNGSLFLNNNNNLMESSGSISDLGKGLSSSISLLSEPVFSSFSSSSSSRSTSVQNSTSIRYPPLVSSTTPLLLSVT